jgi:hypothetical protein
MTETAASLASDLPPRTISFYREVLEALKSRRIGALVGGSWAFEARTGIGGRTKDLDLFIRPRDVEAALALLGDRYRTEMTSPLWIAKVFDGQEIVDLIFSSGNGLCTVDDAWFRHATRATILGVRTRIIPIEEMIWSKSFLMERDRFDGADVQHLILAARGRLDADRLLQRFGVHWRVLLAHVTLFDYAFPSERGLIPARLRETLVERAATDGQPRDAKRVCYGPFVSRHQYVTDIEDGGFVDARRA